MPVNTLPILKPYGNLQMFFFCFKIFVFNGTEIKVVRGNPGKTHPGSQAAKALEHSFGLVRT